MSAILPLVQGKPKLGRKRRRKSLKDYAEIALSPMPRQGNSLSECLFAFLEIAIGSYCGYLILSTLNRTYAVSREMSDFVLRPAWIIFFMPPCMASLGLVLLFHDRVKARLFNDGLKRAVPQSWENPVLPNFLHKICVVWSTACVVLSLALIPVHSRFTGRQMTTQALWPMPERQHPYTDVKRIALAYYYSAPGAHSRGGWSRERALYLRFRDGTFWTTMNGLAEATLEQRQALADFVSKRSGVPVEYPAPGDFTCWSSRSASRQNQLLTAGSDHIGQRDSGSSNLTIDRASVTERISMTVLKRSSGKFSTVGYQGRAVVDTARLLKSKPVRGTLRKLSDKISDSRSATVGLNPEKK